MILVFDYCAGWGITICTAACMLANKWAGNGIQLCMFISAVLHVDGGKPRGNSNHQSSQGVGKEL
jgi:hypothetical protein